jgi:hypothetical protein
VTRNLLVVMDILACRANDRDQNTMADCIDEPPATPRDDWVENLIVECELDRHRVRGGVTSFGSIAKMSTRRPGPTATSWVIWVGECAASWHEDGNGQRWMSPTAGG